MAVSANKLAGMYGISIEVILPWSPSLLLLAFTAASFTCRTSLQNPILRVQSKVWL